MMRSVVLAVVASACAIVGVLSVIGAGIAHWVRRRRWERELDREFPAQ